MRRQPRRVQHHLRFAWRAWANMVAAHHKVQHSEAVNAMAGPGARRPHGVPGGARIRELSAEDEEAPPMPQAL